MTTPESKETCECCEKFNVQWKLKDAYNVDKTYNVCSNCLIGLVNLSLTPRQYFNLLKRGHKSSEYQIHSDFYDYEGHALQPKD